MTVPLATLSHCWVRAVARSPSLSRYLSLFPPRAFPNVSYLHAVEVRSLAPALSLSLLLSRLRPLPSPAAPMLLPGGTTTLSALDSLFPLFAPAPAAVRTCTFASAASRADRSPACLLAIPLPCVTRPPSVCTCIPLSQQCCLVRAHPERSPGRVPCVSVLSPRSPLRRTQSQCARAQTTRRLLLITSWRAVGHAAPVCLSSTPILRLPRVTPPRV